MKSILKPVLAILLAVTLASQLIACSEKKPQPVAPAPKSDKQIYNSVVKLVGPGGRGSCSGQQIKAPSGALYILSAAHCEVLKDKDGSITVIREDGLSVQRRVIAEDTKSDLLLIESAPGVSALEIADEMKMRQEVRTFTHGAGFDTYKTEGVLIMLKKIQIPIDQENCEKGMEKYKIVKAETFFGVFEMCAIDVVEVVSTAMTVPGSSGGAIVDNMGDLVAVVSAGDGKFGYFVPLSDIKRFVKAY